MKEKIGGYWKARFRQELARELQRSEWPSLRQQAEAAFDTVATEMANTILENLKGALPAVLERHRNHPQPVVVSKTGKEA